MVLCEGSANNETWIDRGTRSSTVVQRSRHHVIYGGGGRRSYGRGPLGLRLGLCALPWRVAAHFVGPAYATKSSRFAGISSDGETRTRTGDTTIFRRACQSLEPCENSCKQEG